MTNKLDYQIEILQAAKEGKPLQWRSRTSSKREWRDDVIIPKEGVLFDFTNYEFRVKKEPDVLYQVECRYVSSNEWSLYSRRVSKEKAEKLEVQARVIYPYTRIRKFVEVLEDED